MPFAYAKREPRYTTPAEEKRIRKCVESVAIEAARAGGADAGLVQRYTYYFRTVFNSMLRDRRQEPHDVV